MKKYLPTIIMSFFAVMLVGFSVVRAYEMLQNVTVQGDGYFNYAGESEESLGSGTIVNSRTENRIVYSGEAFDVLGSRVGTTTTGRYFGASAASSTYPILLDPTSDVGTLTIGILNASSTPSGLLTITLLASNDIHCDTATTTTIFADTVKTSDINWFDAGSYIRNSATVTSLTTATSTIQYAPKGKAQNRMIHLEGLNSRCLAVEITGSSTEAWIQFKQRPNN